MKEKLEFKDIDFERHSELCIKFRADSFFESFGTDEPFYENDNTGEVYINWLKSKVSETYKAMHVWFEGKIIGQLEFGKRNVDDPFGYVNLYYLVPEVRGKGLSNYLEEYTVSFFKLYNYNKVRLSVSPTNKRAIGFYLKNGWKDIGVRNGPGRTGRGLKFVVHYMEKLL